MSQDNNQTESKSVPDASDTIPDQTEGGIAPMLWLAIPFVLVMIYGALSN